MAAYCVALNRKVACTDMGYESNRLYYTSNVGRLKSCRTFDIIIFRAIYFAL